MYDHTIMIVYYIRFDKSVLGRVRNCVGEQALCCEMVASSYVHQPYHSYADFMFRLHSDPTHAIVVAGVLHCVWSELPTKGIPYSIIHRLVATQFSYLSGIYYLL